MLRRIFVICSFILALLAGALYYGHTREITVVVAAQDLKVGSRISDSQLQRRRVHPNSIPVGAARSVELVTGRLVSVPILAGQYVPLRALSERAGTAIGVGLEVPRGYKVISIPIAPAFAVGGALRPGDYVDVLAMQAPLPAGVQRTPQAPVQAPALTGVAIGTGGQDPTPTELIGRHVLVVGLRSEQGAAVEEPASGGRGLNFASAKVGSLLLAIPPQDTTRYLVAAAASTFFIALSLD
jgi:Flp pilus assembly protein CpaB